MLQGCTGQEHRELPKVGSATTYCPSALFRVETRGGKSRYMCRECVELIAEALVEKDRQRISELWNQMLPELVDPELVDPEAGRNGKEG